MQLWRAEGHNLCPSCSTPISTTLFFVKYLGRVLVPEELGPTEASLPEVVRAKAEVLERPGKHMVKIKVNRGHVRFETLSENPVTLRFKRSMQDVVRVDKMVGWNGVNA